MPLSPIFNSNIITVAKLQKFFTGLKSKFLSLTGGEITGDLKVDGTFTLDIDDEDYDAGISFQQQLDNNLGAILILRGYANGESSTSYRPVIRNVATPSSDYDVANKKYVDDNTANPTLHLVDLNLDGSVNLSASSLVYDTIKSNLSNPKRTDYLDCFWENGQGTNSFTRFKANAVGISDVNNGDVMFEGELFYLGIPIWIVFTLSPQNVLTTVAIIRREDTANKVQSIVSNSASAVKYPSAKAVFDEFQRKPVVVYSDSTGLAAIGANMSASPAWQLTNLDLTPYRRIKIWTKAAQKSGSTASASTTPTTCLEMMLDPTLAISAYGNHYLASNIIQKSNDSNRLATLTCAVSADKTSFVVLRQTNLYGTAATDNADVGSNVVLIEGYYD